MDQQLRDIQAVLRKYSNFEECVVTAISCEDFGTTVAITFDYIWRADGSVRRDDEDRCAVTARFKIVQEFAMSNQLRPALLDDNMSNLDWGFAEISQLVVRDDARSARFTHPKIGFHHAMLEWERATWMDIVFAHLEVEEAATCEP